MRSDEQIGVVDEEDDYNQDSSNFRSDASGSSKKHGKDSSMMNS